MFLKRDHRRLITQHARSNIKLSIALKKKKKVEFTVDYFFFSVFVYVEKRRKCCAGSSYGEEALPGWHGDSYNYGHDQQVVAYSSDLFEALSFYRTRCIMCRFVRAI